MFRILICEDEAHHMSVIDGITQKWAQMNAQEIEIETYKNAEEFLRYSGRGEAFDLAFLDIKMGAMDGFDLARYIRRIDMRMLIVFVTNHFDYVFKAFEVEAFRFLRKPVKEGECMNVLNAAIERINKRGQEIYVLQIEGLSVKIPKADIFYCESQRHYIELHANDTTYQFRGEMKKLEEDFGEPMFYRCHRSYLVNLKHVFQIHESEVVLTNKERLPVSRNRWVGFNECFLAVHVDNESPGNMVVVTSRDMVEG